MPISVKHFFLSFTFFCVHAIWGQNDFIQGQLLDSNTSKPVVFATIRIEGKALGVISNQDGGFRLPLKFKDEGDTLIVSSMGYERKRIAMLDLSQDELNIIKLTPGVIKLKEVVLSKKQKRRGPLSAKSIVRKAIQAIPKKFPRHPSSVIGYYRDYQFSERKYVNLNEAILEVFDLGFQKLDNLNTKVQIYDKKQNFDFKRDTISDNKYGDDENYMKIINNAYLFDYGGNEFVILRVHDAIRNYKIDSYDFVNQLETDLIKNHFFRKLEDTYIDEEELYTIRMNKTFFGYKVSGLLYISKQDFAIHKLKYTVYENFGLRSKRRNKKEKDQKLFFEIITEYQRADDGKMYLNYISFHNDFMLIEPPEFEVDAIRWLGTCQCFEVRFNKYIDTSSAGDLNNYDWTFKGKKVKFNEVVVFDNAVRLFPDFDAETLKNMSVLLSSKKKNPDGSNKHLKTKVLNIRDRGLKYELGKNKHRDFQQFREFFVQRINASKEPPKDKNTFMNKTKPIFEDQPVTKPTDFDNYWMNTPLKSRQ
ncbi:carboxypeptidase-like regulatory domain-containing protein [Flagellimonas sp. S174]|uniref:carboxypeptidase-like regulatory domain-containing protein n=1 Tax=Flagellimonas sp. S174 TaxID=3410790 RepID=UPI003BF594EA